MKAVRSKNTGPELLVAEALRSARFRFVQHDSTLPGTPEFVLVRHRVAIFVNGCFWHYHTCKRGRSIPATRRQFWESKKRKNQARDRKTRAQLRRRGYRVLVLWECKLTDLSRIKTMVRSFVQAPHGNGLP